MNEPKAAPGIAPREPLRQDDIDQIIEGIEHFIIGPVEDPELREIWQPYIDKLRGVKVAEPGAAPREPQLQKIADYLCRLAKRTTQPPRGFKVTRRDHDDGEIVYQITGEDVDDVDVVTQIAFVNSTRHDADFIAACLAQAPLFTELLKSAGEAEQEIRTLRTQLADVQAILDFTQDESLADVLDNLRFDAERSVKIANEIKALESWPPPSWPSMNDRWIYAAVLDRALKAEAETARLTDDYWQRPKVQELIAETARLRTQLEKYESRRPDGDGPDSHSVFNGAYPVEGSGSNPDDSLSLDDLRAHYAAALANWDECLRQLKIAEQDAVALRATLIALRDEMEEQARELHRQADYMDGCNGRPFDAGQRLILRTRADEAGQLADALTQAAGLPK